VNRLLIAPDAKLASLQCLPGKQKINEQNQYQSHDKNPINVHGKLRDKTITTKLLSGL
jgi:hypothetical protein